MLPGPRTVCKRQERLGRQQARQRHLCQLESHCRRQVRQEAPAAPNRVALHHVLQLQHRCNKCWRHARVRAVVVQQATQVERV
eukprot:351896-Chlamydomonas_euryale.AAC.2